MAKHGYQLSSSQYHMSLLCQHSVAYGGLCLEACDCSLALNFSATLTSILCSMYVHCATLEGQLVCICSGV